MESGACNAIYKQYCGVVNIHCGVVNIHCGVVNTHCGVVNIHCGVVNIHWVSIAWNGWMGALTSGCGFI